MKLRDVGSVKWGGMVYAVEWIADMVDNQGPLGFVSHDNKTIKMDPAQDVAGVFIHENIHCAERFLGYRTDEEVTSKVETAVRAFLADNSQAIRALLDEIDAEVKTHGSKRHHKSRR